MRWNRDRPGSRGHPILRRRDARLCSRPVPEGMVQRIPGVLVFDEAHEQAHGPALGYDELGLARVAVPLGRDRVISIGGVCPGPQARLRRGLAAGQLPVRPDVVARVAVRVDLQVVLVLRLGLPEGSRWLHLGDDRARPQARRVDVGDRLLGNPPLLVGGVVDGRPVAPPDVIALAVPGRRVVNLEEELQQVAVARRRRIEDDLDALGMVAMVAVGGVGDVTARVPDSGRDDAGEVADQLLDTPEAASGEDGALGCLGHVSTFLADVVLLTVASSVLSGTTIALSAGRRTRGTAWSVPGRLEAPARTSHASGCEHPALAGAMAASDEPVTGTGSR